MKQSASAAISPYYRKFVNDRDKGLEVLLTKGQSEVNDHLRKCFLRLVEIVTYRYSQIPAESMMNSFARATILNIQLSLDHEIQLASKDISNVIKRVNKHAFLLSMASEGEAIARAKGSKTRINIPKGSAEIVAEETSSGGVIYDRVYLELSRIVRKIIDAIELSRVNNDSLSDCIIRVKRALPKSRQVKIPRRTLKPIPVLEAEVKKPEDMVDLSMDDQEWDALVKDYMEEYVPKWRGPDNVFDIPTEANNEEWYAWEIESQMNHEFLDKVRGGQVAAAKQNGINDFVWIAIIDDRTDECCAWRDGLTTKEIEAELKGKHADDECDALIPPAHFNCRCTAAPMLDDMPEKPESNQGEFETWLMT